MAFFYFIRHGETVWNTEGRFCGHTDVPLSDVGRRQARLLAARLKPIPVKALYSSPLQRALETARLIGEVVGRDPVLDQRLIELNYGAWEGLTLEEIKRAGPAIFQTWKHDPGNVAPPEGESGVQLVERVMPFLSDMARRHEYGNVLVVCHKTVCRLIACHLLGIPLAEYRQAVQVDNAALNTFEVTNGVWRVVTMNDTSHLSPPPAEYSHL